MRTGFALAGAIVLAASAWADPPQRVPAPAANLAQLQPRQVIVRKEAWVGKPRFETSRLTVKFSDEAKVRLGGQGVQSLANANLAQVHKIVQRFGLTFESAIDLPENVIESVERRAAFASGYTQPDFRGIFFVNGPERQIERAANALNALDLVEVAYFTTEVVDHGGSTPPAPGTALAAASMGSIGNPPPNMAGLQKYHYQFLDQNGNGIIEVFGPDGNPSTLSDNEFYGGFDQPTAYAWSDFLVDEGLIHDSWRRRDNGARGATIKVGVIEGNAQVGPDNPHFDLRHVILEPGQVLFPHLIEEKNHGSATLGEIGAKDHGDLGPEDERGVVGMVPDAEIWFFPTRSVSHPGGRTFSAFISAYSFFGRGDVLSASIGFTPGPLVQNPIMALIIQTGTDIGITTVMSAGNDCFNHDEFGDEWPAGNGGGVIVGASLPIIPSRPDLLPYTRLAFSNHYFQNPGVRTHCQAWGANIVTCGYGDLYTASDPEDRSQYYTNSFGGTSGAAPMIASTAVSLQGLSKMFFGIPLTPTQIRGLLESGFLQEGIPPPCVSGVVDDAPCLEIFYARDPMCASSDPEPDLIGPLPEWDGLAPALFTGPWFDQSSPIDFASVITGEHLFGNKESLRVAEGNTMVVKARFQRAGRKDGTDPFPSPTYIFGGFFTDVGVIGQTPMTQINGFTITIVSTVNNASFPILGVEAFNYVSNRWDMIGTSATMNAVFVINGQPDRYVEPTTGEFMVRTWIMNAGFGSGRFLTAYDLIGIDITGGGFGSGG